MSCVLFDKELKELLPCPLAVGFQGPHLILPGIPQFLPEAGEPASTFASDFWVRKLAEFENRANKYELSLGQLPQAPDHLTLISFDCIHWMVPCWPIYLAFSYACSINISIVHWSSPLVPLHYDDYTHIVSDCWCHHLPFCVGVQSSPLLWRNLPWALVFCWKTRSYSVMLVLLSPARFLSYW